MRKWIAGVICMAAGLGFAVVRGEGPTTAPTTQDVVAADQSTPKGTLLLLAQATDSGDFAAVRSLLHAAGPTEERVVQVLVDRAAAYAGFRTAAAGQFGQDAADQLSGHSPAELAAANAQIQQAQVQIEGDTATLSLEDQPVELVCVAGQWKLSVATLVRGAEDSDVQRWLDQIRLLSDVVKQTSADIEAGKFKTPQEVNDAIRANLVTAMLRSTAAETQPTTTPAQ